MDKATWDHQHQASASEVAVYLPQDVERYRGNPFLMALPPILEDVDVIRSMQHLVVATAGQRALPSKVRLHEVYGVEDFFQPLDIHVDLFDQISVMIRSGYVGRNPNDPRFLRKMHLALASADQDDDPPKMPVERRRGRAGGRALSLLGLSGVGKSRAVDAVLDTYPQQVIAHPRLFGPLGATKQVVWIKLTCPDDGSIKGLCIAGIAAIDDALGTDYTRAYVTRTATVDTLRQGLIRISYLHGLGLLVIDEVQHLSRAKSGGAERMVDFFKILSDVMEVPVLVVGTEDAADVLGGSFQGARRHSGLPLFEPMPLWTAEQGGGTVLNENYAFFYRSLFQAQFLREPIEPDQSLLEELHWLNQGVTALDVKLFMLTQARALAIGAERLTVELFRSVHEDAFGLLREHLQAMRRGMTLDRSAFDKEIRAVSAGNIGQGRASPRSITPPPVTSAGDDASPDASAVGQKEAPERRSRAGTSNQSLRALVKKGLTDGQSAHEVLSRHGIARPLGSELLAEAQAMTEAVA